jgi:hypothetical protein
MGGVIHTGSDAYHRAGQSDFDHRCRRMWNSRDRNVIGDTRHIPGCERGRHVATRGTSPPEYLLRADRPAPRHLGDPSTRFHCLRDNASLLIRRPTTTTRRSGQDLDPSESTLRVILNVKHNDSSKPAA